MKKFLLIGAMLFWAPHGWAADAAKNFILTIDGKDFEINAGDTLKANAKSGSEFEVKLTRKEFSTFNQGKLSFEYRSDLSVASTDVDKDIHQHLVASALGTMLIVQQYDRMSPEGLEDFMLKQLTESAVGGADAKLEKSDYTKTLSDGTVLKGLKAALTSSAEDISFEVVATPRAANGGVMAISRINTDASADEKKIIERFWASLKIGK
jgi:hypothetical protein